MSLRERIEKWKNGEAKDPLYNERYPGEFQDSQNVQPPYNQHQQQLKIDNNNNIISDHPLMNERDHVSEWELVNRAQRSRLKKRAQKLHQDLISIDNILLEYCKQKKDVLEELAPYQFVIKKKPQDEYTLIYEFSLEYQDLSYEYKITANDVYTNDETGEIVVDWSVKDLQKNIKKDLGNIKNIIYQICEWFVEELKDFYKNPDKEDPKVEHLINQLRSDLSPDDIINLYQEIKALPDSSDKSVLIDMLKDRAKSACKKYKITKFGRKRLVQSLGIEDFQMTIDPEEEDEKEEDVGEDSEFKEKLKRYKKRKEHHRHDIYNYENGYDPKYIYYRMPGILT